MTNHFFKIQDIKDNKKLNNFLKKSQKELSDFFGIKIRFPSIFFINSRKQYNDIWKTKSKDWMVGGANGRNVFILDPKIYTKESSHKDPNDFWLVLKHEYCHIAFRQYCGHSIPKWLNEGLANYLASQVKKKPTKKEALRVFDYYQKLDWRIYNIGYFWTKFLIEEFGKKKLLTLIKSIDSQTTEKEFAKKFHQVYKFHYSKTDFEKILEEK